MRPDIDILRTIYLDSFNDIQNIQLIIHCWSSSKSERPTSEEVQAYSTSINQKNVYFTNAFILKCVT